MDTKELRSLDFFMGLGFAGIGLLMCAGSLQMFKDPALAGTQLVSNPGMTSLVVGLLLVVMGAILALIGWSGAGRPVSIGIDSLRALLRNQAFWKSVLVLALIALYLFGFWGRLPYWLATFLFLSLNMLVFKAGAWWKIALIAAATTALVIYFFGILARVPLP